MTDFQKIFKFDSTQIRRINLRRIKIKPQPYLAVTALLNYPDTINYRYFTNSNNAVNIAKLEQTYDCRQSVD